MNVYKQAYDLSLADIQKYPVWEYILEDLGLPGQDERTVRPYLSTPLDTNRTMLIVRTTFKLANGKKMEGFIKPIQYKQHPRWGEPLIPIDHFPVIITDRGQVVFHYGTRKPDNEEIDHNYILLGFKSQEVFPIAYVSDIKIKDCILEGVINGFMYFEENQKGFGQMINMKPSDIHIVT
jgi:hypothetical protein